MKNRLLAKAGAVVETLCAAPRPLSIRELAVRLDLPTPTLSRLCADLVELGWLEKTDYHRFAPGLALPRLGALAEGLTPLIALAAPQIESFAVETGLNGLLSGCDGTHCYRLFARSLKESDRNIFRRSGADVALFGVTGLDAAAVRELIAARSPDLTDVEKNAIDRELDAVRSQNLLIRVSTLRQWYITAPFRHRERGFAVTFYGQGRPEQSPERLGGELLNLTARIRTAWSRSYADSHPLISSREKK